jgi:hypothetical protein
MLKRCPDCQQEKDVSAFSKNASQPDGLQFYCKQCYSLRSAAAYRRKRERAGRTVRVRRQDPEGYKFCPRCSTVHPHARFSKAPKQPGGLNAWCKVCVAAKARETRFLKVYGLTLEERDAMIAAQGGVCAICEKHEAVHVDHDHATGAVRGVLCFRCNAALGQVADSSETLRRMIDYIERTS